MAFEPIDATTFSLEIEEQYLKVVKGDTDIRWLILSPNSKKQYEPELTGQEFSEFLQSFDENKVQYGLARVSPPGSDVQKLILVGWCPDSAPLKTRSSFAQNFGLIANQVLKTYHVQVTARDEDDLDESELLMKVSNSAGARYSIQQPESRKNISERFTSKAPNSVPIVKHGLSESTSKASSNEASSDVASRPVVSVPVIKPAEKVIKKDTFEDDWDEPEIKERDFFKEPLKAQEPSWKPIGKVDLQQVIASEMKREDPRLVIGTSTFENKINPQAEIAKLKEESKLKRDAEYNKMLGESNTSTTVTGIVKNADKVNPSVQINKTPAQIWAERKRMEQESGNAENKNTMSDIISPVGNVETSLKDMKIDEPVLVKPSQTTNKEPRPETIKYDPSDSWIEKRKQMGHPLPTKSSNLPNSGSEHEEDRSDTESDDDEAIPSLPARKSVSPSPAMPSDDESPELPVRRTIPPIRAKDDNIEDDTDAPLDQNDTSSIESSVGDSGEVPSMPKRNTAPVPPPPSRKSQVPKQSPPAAIAEYDYDAAEDNEITFNEGDKIVNIQFVDDDWWLGELEKSGEKGLFPSNYVSLIK